MGTPAVTRRGGGPVHGAAAASFKITNLPSLPNWRKWPNSFDASTANPHRLETASKGRWLPPTRAREMAAAREVFDRRPMQDCELGIHD